MSFSGDGRPDFAMLDADMLYVLKSRGGGHGHRQAHPASNGHQRSDTYDRPSAWDHQQAALKRRRKLEGSTLKSAARACKTAAWLAAAILWIAGTGVARAQMSLPGNFDVAVTGAATYSVPIAAPPGTAGMVPALTLDYGSQQGNGLVGTGWALGGLPAVIRCPRTIAEDGITGGVSYDANDRFCLGAERLFAINGGTYGADGTEYRTEIESFNRVISHGSAGNGPAWFEVHTKSGQVMEFAHTADSQVLAQGKTTARLWALDKLSDSTGNYLTVTYTDDTANGQFYPSRVDYTGNAAAGLATYNSVQFTYAARPDAIVLYQAGSIIRTTQRLSEVKSFAGSTLVTDYKLAYQQSPSSQASELTSITLCVGDGSCLPATTFVWTNGGSGTPTPRFTTLSGDDFGAPPSNNWIFVTGDFNGDGKTDFAMLGGTPASQASQLFVFMSNGDGTFNVTFKTLSGDNLGEPPSANWITIVGDFNGDGKTDFAMLGGTPASQASQLFVFLSNGDGTFNVTFKTLSGDNFGEPPSANWDLITGDFNGDGRTDFALLGGVANGASQLFVFTSNGDGTFATTFTTLGCCVFGEPPHNNWYITTGDFNGDSRTDFLMLGGTPSSQASQLFVFLSNGDGTFTIKFTTLSGDNLGLPSTDNRWSMMTGDFNGDGKTDVAMMGGTTGASQLFVFTSNGDGTFTTAFTTLGCCVFGMPPTNNWYITTGDFNGDGKTDIAMLGGTPASQASQLFMLLSNGDGTFAISETTLSGDNFGTPSTNGLWNVVTGDFNGDGKTDFLTLGGVASGASQLFMFLATGPVPDLLSSITTGLGAATQITYQPLTNPAVYKKDSGATYPTMEFEGPMYVVSRVEAANGVGGNYSTTYTYEGQRLYVQGIGFLGFRVVTATDPQTGIVKTTTFTQGIPAGFPRPNLVAKVAQSLNGQVLNQTTNTYGDVKLDTTRYFVFLQQSVTSSSDLDGSALPTITTTYQYDAFGNATNVVVATPDGASKTTTNTYTNDTTNWFLGRLTNATVTSNLP
jgi:hypothetical protein